MKQGATVKALHDPNQLHNYNAVSTHSRRRISTWERPSYKLKVCKVSESGILKYVVLRSTLPRRSS